MSDKKSSCRFTMQFNPADPQHLQTIQILNQQGRRKAQYIVNAVIHYLHRTESSSTPQPATTDIALIESIVRRIFQEMSTQTVTQIPKSSASAPANESTPAPSLSQHLNSNSIAAISSSLASFRR